MFIIGRIYIANLRGIYPLVHLSFIGYQLLLIIIYGYHLWFIANIN